eukprot:TRINITY_DN508_c0_g1_i1.p1 TRINITY_DN508_c0_g1~~TRINITY_DN508_c0_g1_i1.p1  ORF type:complete len:536 (+),score=129.06 TRINITY_DN508_c0_g1_i1:85-1692(+)
MSEGLLPVKLLQQNTEQEKGERARVTSFFGAYAISDLVKTTLGPKGMDKILQSSGDNRDISVTNDGATILKSIHVDNPAAKILVDISKTQDAEVGDGTTSVCVLAGELLREAEQLIQQKIHPQTIIEGWRAAEEVALKALEESTQDHGSDQEKLRHDLFNIARTTLSSKVLAQFKDKFANIAVDAVLRIKRSIDLDHIHILKKLGGTLEDSFLDEGYILDKKIGVGQPKQIKDAKILIANTAMDTDKIKIFSAKIKTSEPEKVAELEAAERERMLNKCKKIISHGINCFINRQLIYNLPEQVFADHGVMAIEHADFEGIERLALVTGGEIVSTFDDPKRVKLGHAKLIEEVIIGEDKMIRFSGVAGGEACTIVLRGSSKHILDEAERSLHDALSVLSQALKDTRTVLGGGCSDMVMSLAVEKLGQTTPGKKFLAIEAYARALRAIPTILADNGGYDSSDLVSQLRAAHYEGKKTSGLDMDHGVVSDVEALGITESLKVKKQVVISASEAAAMILRVDQIIKAAPRKREHDPRYGH